MVMKADLEKVKIIQLQSEIKTFQAKHTIAESGYYRARNYLCEFLSSEIRSGEHI